MRLRHLVANPSSNSPVVTDAKRMLRIVDIDTLNLANHIRPGDGLLWGQGTSEPLALVEKLIEQRAEIGKIKAFVGLTLTNTLRAEHTDHISVSSYGAPGANAKLMAAGVLDIIPCNYSAVLGLIATGKIPVDVVLVQISPAGPDGTHSLGFSNDTLPVAMRQARLVIAEINAHVPWTHMDAPLDVDRIDFAVESSYQPPLITIPAPGPVEQSIAEHIAGHIPDGATLQYGIGSIPSALIRSLSNHKNLGLHSGLVSEEFIDLAEQGVITNANKAVFPGISISAVAIGGPRLKAYLHDNPEFQMHQASTTHGPSVLAKIDNLVAINSALEVDLFGQVNAEQIGDRYFGTIGGQVDFMHAASTSDNGLSIIAMPASFGKSGNSRITDKLSGPLVTTARADVDMVVTEFGFADLRGKTLQQRALDLVSIAPPDHRERLAGSIRNIS
ncbi:MAG: acetyl-CoA hydrolase/transferase family protein [Rhodospirillaceae bacterium]|nr:acetyl-CoA hydrolase/transferase family protein [Rhodospirillaceae bacterium]